VIRMISILIISQFLFCGISLAQDYIIGGGDVLQVAVWDVPRLSVQVVVRPDGKITIPAIGDVQAAGMTPEDLAKSLKQVMAKMVHKPIVSLTVNEVTNNRIYVAGGGVPPEIVLMNNQMTLFQFLCRFESFEHADLSRAFVMRDGRKIIENFENFFSGDFSHDIELIANDIVFIPNYLDNKVYVVGAVNEPRYIPYRSELKVLDAILEAGGFNEYADKGDVVIIREKVFPDGRVEKVQLEADIDDLLKGKDLRQNYLLEPGDYVNVKERIF